jgi:hypothetical protein
MESTTGEGAMNHIRWAAWGVIDIETLERMQRRNYIKRARADLEGIAKLECGGSTVRPYYRIEFPTPKPEAGEHPKPCSHAVGGDQAFKKVCQWLLKELGEGDVSGEDGGVRSAGAQA